MPHPRLILPGQTRFITRRVLERRLLLLPIGRSHHIFGYHFTRLSERHGIDVHALTVMSNHYHCLETDPLGTTPDFVRDLHAITGRNLNANQGRWDSFWSGQRTSMLAVLDEEDVLDKIVYTLTNPVAAGLVKRYTDWPGLRTTPQDYLRSRGRVFKRPKGFFCKDTDAPSEVELRLTLPPQLRHREPVEVVEELHERIRIREEAIAKDLAESQRTFMGPARIRRQGRNSIPKTREKKRTLSPTVAAKDPERRIAFLEAQAVFRQEYQKALKLWMAGAELTVFPEGTFKMRRFPRVKMEARPPPIPLAA